MREKAIQVVTMILYMCILNVIFYLIGAYCIQCDYARYAEGELLFSDVFLIAVYAFIQIMVFPIHKRYRVVIVSWLYLTIGLMLNHNDVTGYGGEMWDMTATAISKFCLLIGSLNIELLRAQSCFLFFALYLIFTGYSYKWLYKVVTNHIAQKRAHGQETASL